MNRLIGGVLVFSGLIALKSAFSEVTPVDKPFDSEFKSFNAEFESYLLKAEVIGEGLGEGSFGRVFTLPDGNVLKIVNLDDQSRAIRKQKAQANFVRDYLIKTRSGEWKESPFLPKIYHYNEGTASPKMISLMEQEGVSSRNPLSNQQVAFWVMEKIPYIAEDYDWMDYESMGVLEDEKDWRTQLKEGLKVWLDKQNMRGLRPDDIHEGNYGFRETSKGATPVYFDMSFTGNESLPYVA